MRENDPLTRFRLRDGAPSPEARRVAWGRLEDAMRRDRPRRRRSPVVAVAGAVAGALAVAAAVGIVVSNRPQTTTVAGPPGEIAVTISPAELERRVLHVESWPGRQPPDGTVYLLAPTGANRVIKVTDERLVGDFLSEQLSLHPTSLAVTRDGTIWALDGASLLRRTPGPDSGQTTFEDQPPTVSAPQRLQSDPTGLYVLDGAGLWHHVVDSDGEPTTSSASPLAPLGDGRRALFESMPDGFRVATSGAGGEPGLSWRVRSERRLVPLRLLAAPGDGIVVAVVDADAPSERFGPTIIVLDGDGLRASFALPGEMAPVSASGALLHIDSDDAEQRLQRYDIGDTASDRPASREDLVGTWRWSDLAGHWEQPPSITFKASGEAAYYDGCNGASGPWRLDGDRFVVEWGPQQLIGCENVTHPTGPRAVMDGGELVFLRDDGAEVARYERVLDGTR